MATFLAACMLMGAGNCIRGEGDNRSGGDDPTGISDG